MIEKFLSDQGTQRYFAENNACVTKFEHYYKGCNKLGSLVESCVKIVKRSLSGSIKNNVLTFRDFEYFVAQTKHLINRRPVAFHESLRDSYSPELPEPISPESLLHGHDLLSVNLIPGLNITEYEEIDDLDFDPVSNVCESFTKLKKVRSNLSNCITKNSYQN